MKKMNRCVVAALLAFALVGCSLFNPPSSGTVTTNDISSLQKVLMSSYYAERGGAPAGAKGLTPFLKVNRSSPGAKTTVPTSRLSDSSFASLSPTTFVGYPEPDQTTTFTVTTKDAANNVYDVTATTTYPSTDARASYVEEYYVKDGNPTWGTAADGIWSSDDPIVKLSGGSWVQDQTARVQQVLTFADGTTRTETIVAQTRDWGASPTNQPKFDAFSITGSLEFDQAFYPVESADSRVRFSSVVMYYVTPAATTSTSYWFWEGTQTKTILGIRYYTEYWDTGASSFNSYTICFEKTLNTIATTGGDFTEVLATVAVGSEFDTLAESVLRQHVYYPLDSSGNLVLASGEKSTRMQTRVVDIADYKDFILQQMDTDSVELSGWTTTTIYTPTSTEDEVAAGDIDPALLTFLFSRDYTATTDGLPLMVPPGTTDITGTGDLATVYASIVEGAALITTGSAISGSLIPAGQEWFFDGTQGKTIDYNPDYDLTTTGTVEAWVYVGEHTNTGGIVHKGDRADFKDECYSLQFWGSQGQVAMLVDYTATPNYTSVLSTIKLNTDKWYYLVATWDATASTPVLKLYINGTLNNSTTTTTAKLTAQLNGSDLHVGAQIPVTYNATYGYFGFDGKINGVRVLKTVSSAATIAADYATYITETVNW